MRVMARQITCAILTMAGAACGGCGSKPPPPAPMPPMVPPQPVAPVMPAPAPCDQTQVLAMSTTMLARSAAEAPGMKPEGAPVCGIVPEGQTVTSPTIILEPGYCYTFLGQSLPPTAQMEMILQYDPAAAAGPLLPPGMTGLANMAQSTLLVSTTPGERVSMGEKQSCYQWGALAPATVRLVLKARAGGGPIAAQVFRKKR